MTESEWLSCGNPEPMLQFLRESSERKLRLFACACCRRIDRLITDPRSRAALEFTEAHLEKTSRRKGRKAVERAAREAHREAYERMSTAPSPDKQARRLVVSNALDAAAQTMNTSPLLAADYTSAFACFALAWEAQAASGSNRNPDLLDSFQRPEREQQARLLREIFGNPFRPVAVEPSWLAWNNHTVIHLARGIDEEGAFERMPILADALEESGCTNASILDHLRDGGPHTRGCWVIDLLTGRS